MFDVIKCLSSIVWNRGIFVFFEFSNFRKIKKKIYYENLNEKYVIDNNFFWKTVKRSLAHKMVGKNKIHLTDNNQLIETDPETVFWKQLQPQACNFIKKRYWQRCFPVNFAKILRTPFFIEHLWWLLVRI